MKTKRFFISALILMVGMGSVFAQEDYTKAQKAPQAKEVVLNKNVRTQRGYDSYQAAYKAALHEAQQAYPNKEIGIRNLVKGDVKINSAGSISNYYNYTVVELPSVVARSLYEAIGKATKEIEEGNSFALDKLTITDEQIDKVKIRGQIIDYLLGKGYKVVAKEYLEKLYKEQRGQQSGIFNTETIVKDNNFSAVGYFISVRITDEYVQVQVVNVSTGEYEGNITINF